MLSLAQLSCGRVGVRLLAPAEDARVAPDSAPNEAPPEAGPQPALDAGLDDASAEAGADAADASTEELDSRVEESGVIVPSGPDAALAPCDGSRVLDLCWYLGDFGASCNSTCSTHGGFDPATLSAVGTEEQGGDLGNCHAVMSAFGITADINLGGQVDPLGLGCHQWEDGRPWWLFAPRMSPDSATSAARIACACSQ